MSAGNGREKHDKKLFYLDDHASANAMKALQYSINETKWLRQMRLSKITNKIVDLKLF